MNREQQLRLRCEAICIALVGKSLAKEWWGTTNKAFGKTPNEQWKENYEVVVSYLMQHYE